MGLLLMIYRCECSFFAGFKKHSLSILVVLWALLKRLVQLHSFDRNRNLLGHHGGLVWNMQKVGEKQLQAMLAGLQC